MLKLYFGPGACSFVPHAALDLIQTATGEAFETEIVKLHKGEQQSPLFLALNPNGQVPVLLIEGRPLTQVMAIAWYLDKRYPTLGLLPKDDMARLDAISDLAWMNNSVHPTFTRIFRTDLIAKSEASIAEIKSIAVGQFRQHLEKIQVHLQKNTPYWCGGKSPSFLDFYALVFWRWGGMAGIDPESLPAYKKYVEQLAQEPSVAKTIERERLPLHTYKKPA